MLLFRDRVPSVLSVLELALLLRSWILSFRGHFPILDPGRENTFFIYPTCSESPLHFSSHLLRIWKGKLGLTGR